MDFNVFFYLQEKSSCLYWSQYIYARLALILQPEKPKLTKKKRKADIEDDEEEYEEKKRKDEKKTGSRLAEEEREKILEVMDNEPDVSFNKVYWAAA